MGLTTRIARRVMGLAYLADHPSLIGLRMHGGVLGNHEALNKPWLTGLNIATVLDIGAHTGLFAVTIHRVLPKARIYAFEPLPESFQKLTARMGGVKEFTAFNVGLGEQSGTLPFHRNDSTPSSSFLPMAALHKNVFPHTKNEQTVEVKIETLDAAASALKIDDPLMVKIDVQGYEDRVLRGGEKTVRRAKLVLVETSLERLYEGQPLFADIHKTFSEWGFAYAGALDQMNDPGSGKVLQQDSLFIRL